MAIANPTLQALLGQPAQGGSIAESFGFANNPAVATPQPAAPAAPLSGFDAFAATDPKGLSKAKKYGQAEQFYNTVGISDPKLRDPKYSVIGNIYDQLGSSGVNWVNNYGDWDRYAAAENIARQNIHSMSDLSYNDKGEIIHNATGKPIWMRDPEKNRLNMSAAGKGHVNFEFVKGRDGQPVLVPKWETSTTNLGVLGKLAPLAASFIPGVGAIAAPLVGGLVSAVEGGNFLDIAKNAGIGYLSGQVGSKLMGGLPSTGIAGLDKVVQGAATGGIRSGLQGGDILQGAVSGGIGGATNAAAGYTNQQLLSAGIPDYIASGLTRAGTTLATTGDIQRALMAGGAGMMSGGQGLQGIGGKVNLSNSLIPGGDPELEEGFFANPQEPQGGNMDFSAWGIDDQTTSSADDWNSGDAPDLANWGREDWGNQFDWFDSDNAVDGPEVPSDSYWKDETGQDTPGDDQPGAGQYPVGGGTANPGTSTGGGGMPSWLQSLLGAGGSALGGLASGKGIAALLGALAQYAGRQKATGGGTTRGYQSLPARQYAVSNSQYGPVRMAMGGLAQTPGAYSPKMGGIAGLAQGRLIQGPGDGVSDSIPAQIDGQQPAEIATGEFIFPARVVSEIGNGDTKSGAAKLKQAMEQIMTERRGNRNVAADTNTIRHIQALG